MQKNGLVLSLLIASVILIGVPGAVHALDDVSTMNCDGTIAEIGDQQFAFQQKCGSPTAKEENGQVWVYDYRPGGGVYYVTFTEGTVERIQVGGDE